MPIWEELRNGYRNVIFLLFTGLYLSNFEPLPMKNLIMQKRVLLLTLTKRFFMRNEKGIFLLFEDDIIFT